MEPATFGIPEELREWPLLPSSEIEFKSWGKGIPDGSVESLERELRFKFPTEFVEQSSTHNHAMLAGILVYNTPVCKGLTTNQFLGFGYAAPGVPEVFLQDLVSVVIAADPNFADGPFSSYVPFARVLQSIATEEEKNPYNTKSYLAFKKTDGSVHLLSPPAEKTARVADDFASFLKQSAYLAVD